MEVNPFGLLGSQWMMGLAGAARRNRVHGSLREVPVNRVGVPKPLTAKEHERRRKRRKAQRKARRITRLHRK